jgi:hypothetical protein
VAMDSRYSAVVHRGNSIISIETRKGKNVSRLLGR